MYERKGHAWNSVPVTLKSDQGGGELTHKGSTLREKRGMMVLPPQAGLFLSSGQRGHHMELGLGERTR